jgi:ADP-ribosylglycohydrolase
MAYAEVPASGVRPRTCGFRLSLVDASVLLATPVAGRDVRAAARHASDRLRRFVPVEERPHLADFLEGRIFERSRRELTSDGYVVSALTSSLWCLDRHRDFSAAVLAAVNLGGDTDTTAGITGGMAGLRGGLSAIPSDWIAALPRRDEVMGLAARFADACLSHWEGHGTH